MFSRNRWNRAYRRVVYPQFWRHTTKSSLTFQSHEDLRDQPGGSNQVRSDASPSLSPGSSPAKLRMRFTPQLTMVTKDENGPTSFVLDPDGNPVFYWKGVVSLAILYNFWMIILRMAFPEMREEFISFYIYYLDTLADLIYLCDITVQMRTAYLVDGIPIFDPSKLCRYYTSQPRFLRDVIAIIPSETINSFLPESKKLPKHFFCQSSAVRLNRLLKLPTIFRFYDLADSRTSNPNRIRALRLSLYLAIVIHWIGCLYYMISEYEGLGTNNWVYTDDRRKQRFIRKYIVCLYWSAMTLTTIGDCNPPETDLEYAFTGATFLIGVFLFATVVGNVGDVISNMNATRQEFQAKMDQIKMYLTHRKVPPALQMKVKKWAEYSWSRTQATDESRLLHILPERLRAEIAVHVHLDTIKKVKIFEKCEHGFLCELVLKLRSQIYSPGDYICRAGETGREMYIINHGKVEVVVSNPITGEEVVMAVLSEGNYFGEISLLRLDGVQNRRTADVRSVGYAELLCLSRKDLMMALIEYPEAKTLLEEQAKERMRNNLQAKRTFSIDAFSENTDDMEIEKLKISRDREREDRKRDMSEIRSLIEDLHHLHSTVPRQRTTELEERCRNLQIQVLDQEAELRKAKARIAELERCLVTSKRTQFRRTRRFSLNLPSKKVIEVAPLSMSLDRADTHSDTDIDRSSEMASCGPAKHDKISEVITALNRSFSAEHCHLDGGEQSSPLAEDQVSPLGLRSVPGGAEAAFPGVIPGITISSNFEMDSGESNAQLLDDSSLDFLQEPPDNLYHQSRLSSITSLASINSDFSSRRSSLLSDDEIDRSDDRNNCDSEDDCRWKI